MNQRTNKQKGLKEELGSTQYFLIVAMIVLAVKDNIQSYPDITIPLGNIIVFLILLLISMAFSEKK